MGIGPLRPLWRPSTLGATKLSDEAQMLGDDMLAAYVFDHYNWKYTSCAPPLTRSSRPTSSCTGRKRLRRKRWWLARHASLLRPRRVPFASVSSCCPLLAAPFHAAFCSAHPLLRCCALLRRAPPVHLVALSSVPRHSRSLSRTKRPVRQRGLPGLCQGAGQAFIGSAGSAAAMPMGGGGRRGMHAGT